MVISVRKEKNGMEGYLHCPWNSGGVWVVVREAGARNEKLLVTLRTLADNRQHMTCPESFGSGVLWQILVRGISLLSDLEKKQKEKFLKPVLLNCIFVLRRRGPVSFLSSESQQTSCSREAAGVTRALDREKQVQDTDCSALACVQ